MNSRMTAFYQNRGNAPIPFTTVFECKSDITDVARWRQLLAITGHQAQKGAWAGDDIVDDDLRKILNAYVAIQKVLAENEIPFAHPQVRVSLNDEDDDEDEPVTEQGSCKNPRRTARSRLPAAPRSRMQNRRCPRPDRLQRAPSSSTAWRSPPTCTR